jgi:hypothetical protein
MFGRTETAIWALPVSTTKTVCGVVEQVRGLIADASSEHDLSRILGLAASGSAIGFDFAVDDLRLDEDTVSQLIET